MNEFYLLVAFWANACRLIEFRTVNIRTIIECSVPFSHRSSSPLVHKMPMKTSERSMLCTFVLQKQRALLCSKFFQVSGKKQTMIHYVILAD